MSEIQLGLACAFLGLVLVVLREGRNWPDQGTLVGADRPKKRSKHRVMLYYIAGIASIGDNHMLNAGKSILEPFRIFPAMDTDSHHDIARRERYIKLQKRLEDLERCIHKGGKLDHDILPYFARA